MPARRFPVRTCLVLVALAAALPLPALAQNDASAASLDDFLDRPIITGLTAASATPRIAWVENTRGRRNLWTALAPDFSARQLTTFDQDDGQELSGLMLTPDGEHLVYTRGSSPNAAGEIANPSSDPGGAEQAIWLVPTDGSATPRRLAAGSAAAMQPQGDRVLFARGSEVFEVALAAETGDDGEPASAEPTRLFTARGGIGSLTLSPEGRLIAFVSNRGDHSFIGTYNRDTEAITWIAPSVDRDSNPVFSRDGRMLAFFRSPGLRAGERYDLTSANAFSVWVAFPRLGEAFRVWTSPENGGGFAQYYPGRTLDFAYNNDYVVFTSEHDGYLHLYRAALADGPDPDNLPADAGAVDLTPGTFEIESFAVARDQIAIYVWGNHDDRNRRHVYRTHIERGGLQRKPLGTGSAPREGIEVEPLPLVDGHLVFRGGDARQPLRLMVVGPDGGAPRAISTAPPERFPSDRLVTPEAVTFDAADGQEIHGQLFVPEGPAPEGGRPAVIFLHGGPIRQMLLGWHYSGYYANAYAFNQFLASRGYVVLSVNFRSGIGYGQAFRRAENQGPRGASEYQDVVAGGRFLAARDDVDAARIGLWGGSYGGLLTAQGLARDSDLFAAGVDLHGVHDWSFRATDFPLPGGGWGLGEADLELARSSSPVAAVDTWRSPVLFVHGDDDRNVLFQQTTDLVQRLRARDVTVEMLVLPDEVHGFLRFRSWMRTFEAAFAFFERHLGKPAP